MDFMKGKEKKISGLKKLFPSLTFPSRLTKSSSMPVHFFSKRKSCRYGSNDDKRKKICQVAPDGCFSVYVGPEKQRFVIKTECANHPLFKMLLEDAELEYGFNSEGPITLPCDVDLFYKILAEMDSGKDDDEIHSSCGFVHSSCSPVNPTRRSGNSVPKGSGSYGLITPSRLLKMNHF